MEPRDLSDWGRYVPGRGPVEVARERGLDPADLLVMSSNENAHGPSPMAADAVREAAERAHRYPKAGHVDLTEAIAERWDVMDEQIWLGAGGVGALDYLNRAFIDPGDAVLLSSPGFVYHPKGARFHNADVNEYPLRKEDDFALDPEVMLSAYEGERIVYVTRPHNPTGRWVPLETVEQLAEATDEETLLLVDEAYGEYATGESAVTLLGHRDDVAVMRTFSKAYGLAGARLGYGVVPAVWASVYRKVTTPFAASQLACRAGLAALEDDDHLERSVETARWARDHIREQLDAPTYPSQANFVLADVGDAGAVADALETRGVIVRDCTRFGLPECIRITTDTRERTAAAVEAMNDVLDSIEPR